MSGYSAKKEQARTIITVACQMLEHSRRFAPGLPRGTSTLSDDCLVLLDDATRLFCESMVEPAGKREAVSWASELPGMLYRHPERCQEILAMLESRQATAAGAAERHQPTAAGRTTTA